MNDMTLGRYDADALIGMGMVERVELIMRACFSYLWCWGIVWRD